MKRKTEPKPAPPLRQPRALTRDEAEWMRKLNAHFDDVLMKHHPYADADDFAALNSNGTEEP